MKKYIPFTISYSPMIAEELGSIYAAIVFERLRFWGTTKEDGWFYKTYDELAQETGFERKTIERAVKGLSKKGWIETKVQKDPKGTPKLHYLVLMELYVGKTPTTPETGYSPTPETGYSSYYIKDIHNSETNVSRESEEKREIRIESDSPIIRSSPSRSKYPHAREVFEWFSRPQASWRVNRTELENAEYLYERGEKKVRAALAYCAAHKDDDKFYKVVKPSDLERKWLDLLEYKRKNG